MGSVYVYPGGRVDEADLSEDLALHCRGFTHSGLSERMKIGEKEAIGHYIAAIRESFEESGALLATEHDGSPILFEKESEQERYQTYRQLLNEEEISFEEIVGWEELCLRFNQLIYVAHWVTPEMEGRRYDTRFFLAEAPSSQILKHDDWETIDSLWITPEEAIKKQAEGSLPLAPPTLFTLNQLTSFSNIEEAFTCFAEKEVNAVHPDIDFDDDRLILRLPGDPSHPDGPEENWEGPTQIALVEGVWHLSGEKEG